MKGFAGSESPVADRIRFDRRCCVGRNRLGWQRNIMAVISTISRVGFDRTAKSLVCDLCGFVGGARKGHASKDAAEICTEVELQQGSNRLILAGSPHHTTPI